MPKGNEVREVGVRGSTRGGSSFDELARGLASGNVTRFQALKFVGAAILGAALAPLFPRLSFAQEDGCSPAEELCGSVCCGPTEECCYGVCCELGQECGVDGYCVCSPERIPCGSSCCDPVLEACGEDGLCHNYFCESCQAGGGNCCQTVENGVLVGEACCGPGESTCIRGGEGCLCCPVGTRCPDESLGETFVCVSLY